MSFSVFENHMLLVHENNIILNFSVSRFVTARHNGDNVLISRKNGVLHSIMVLHISLVSGGNSEVNAMKNKNFASCYIVHTQTIL